MIRNIVSFLLIAIVVLGLYKVFGGDFGVALAAVIDIGTKIIDGGSDAFVRAWNALFN